MKKIILAMSLFVSSFAFAQACPTPAQLASDMASATQGGVVSLSGANPLNCPEVSMTETWTGGKLVFSDSPESPTSRGKLYDDATLGPTGTNSNRVFYYHVNGQSKNLRITVLLKNLGSSSGSLVLQKKGTAGPSTSYLYVGKLAFNRWVSSTAGSAVNVPAGSTVRFDSTFDSNNIASGYLVNGIYDYSFNQNHEIIVCAYNQNDNPLTVCPGLSVLTKDSHVRGTFPNADKTYDTASGMVIDTVDGFQSIPLAGGTTNDSYAVGTDVTDGSQQTNVGNYGVLYRMHLSTLSTDSQDLGFAFNPRAGAWGGDVFASGGIFPQANFLVPPSTASISSNTQAGVEGEYIPGTGLTTWLQFMPTGGSSFPIKLLVIPF